MSQFLSDFYKQAQKTDFARTFQFRVQSFADSTFGDNELVYLETAKLPGRQINNIQVPFMGLNFNVPGTASYPGSDSWNVTFRCDEKYNLRAALENATINTFDDSASTGTYRTPNNAQTVVLNLIGKSLAGTDFEIVRQYTLYGAYVVSVGEIGYDIGDNGSIVKIDATVAYQYWRVSGGTSNSSIFKGKA
jgi:hypothetical protein